MSLPSAWGTALACIALTGLSACAKHTSTDRPAATSIQLMNSGPNAVEFRSPHAQGSIRTDADIVLKYVSTTGNPPVWTVGGRELEFNGPELVIAGKRFGPLKGDASIEIGAKGVFVNGERRGDLPK